jgi:hypothetical protein
MPLNPLEIQQSPFIKYVTITTVDVAALGDLDNCFNHQTSPSRLNDCGKAGA